VCSFCSAQSPWQFHQGLPLLGVESCLPSRGTAAYPTADCTRQPPLPEARVAADFGLCPSFQGQPWASCPLWPASRSCPSCPLGPKQGVAVEQRWELWSLAAGQRAELDRCLHRLLEFGVGLFSATYFKRSKTHVVMRALLWLC
jgi:hypothetical protein